MDEITRRLAHISNTDGERERPTGPMLAIANLSPADVLLSRGVGAISDAIVAADHSAYSHAAIWSGNAIIEATLKGGVSEGLPSGERYVFRHEPLLQVEVADRVVLAARSHLGNSYATSEIHLLAVIFKKWGAYGRPRRSLASSILALLGGARAPRLEQWIQDRYTRSAPRICSELVALAYYSSGVALNVVGPEERPRADEEPKVTEDEWTEAASTELEVLASVIDKNLYADSLTEQLATDLSVSTKDAKGILFGHLAMDYHSGIPVDIVTPGDLQFSPSLTFVGKVRL